MLTHRRPRRFPTVTAAVLCYPRDERGLSCVPRLEGRSVEKPNRESANRDDAKEDQHEGDVRLSLRVVLGEAVHLVESVPYETERWRFTQERLAKWAARDE